MTHESVGAQQKDGRNIRRGAFDADEERVAGRAETDCAQVVQAGGAPWSAYFFIDQVYLADTFVGIGFEDVQLLIFVVQSQTQRAGEFSRRRRGWRGFS